MKQTFYFISALFCALFIGGLTMIIIFDDIHYLRQSLTSSYDKERQYYISHLLEDKQQKIGKLIQSGEDSTLLQQEIDKLIKEEFIAKSQLYSAQGVLLASSEKILKEQKTILKQITPIYIDNHLIAFLESSLTPYENKIMEEQIDVSFHLLYAQELIIFFLGMAGLGLIQVIINGIYLRVTKR